MSTRRILALASVTLVLVLTLTGLAAAAGTTVTVRVEGVKRTLLAPKKVRTHSGAIKKGGAPNGSCPATSAAGALNAATRGKWNGTYSSGLGIEVTSILGERHVYSAKGYYWGIWVNNKFAQYGICDLKLHRGEQILFAPAPGSGTAYPTHLTGPKTAGTNRSFKLHAVYYNAAGKARPLAGARLRSGRFSAVTGKNGTATVNVTSPGRFTFTVSKKGFIRSAATVRVA